MPTTRKLPKVTEYIKNVGKSVAFLTIESIKNNTTGISGIVDETEDIFKESISKIKNYKSYKSVEKDVRQSKVYTAVEAGIKNLIEDAKTGKFYNDRSGTSPEYGENALGVEDWDDDFEESSNSSNIKSISDSFNEAIGAAAISQNTIVAKSTGIIVNSNKASTKLILGSLDKAAATITSSVGSVYSAVSNVGQFLSGPLSSHIENSRRFYEENIKQTQEINYILKEMLEMQRNLYKAKDEEYVKSSLNQSMNYNGSVNIRGYGNAVKGNIKQIASSLGLDMLSMDFGENSNPYMLWAAAPFKMILSPIVDRMMSKDFKKALSSFDKGVTTLFSQFLARLNTARKNDDGGFLSILGKLFGIDIKTKDTIDSSNYKKEAVPFDGITRQSIIETIPGYLARIEAALTGHGERYYDYQTGSWKSAKKIKNDFDRDRTRSVANASWQLEYEIEKKAEFFERNGSKDRAKRMKKKAQQTFNKIYNDGGDFRTDHAPGDEFIDSYKYYGYNSEKDFRKNFLDPLGKMVRDIPSLFMNAREDLSKLREEQEKNGGIQRHLFNGTFDLEGLGISNNRNDPSKAHFKGSGLLASSLDEHGKNVFWYLNNIIDTIRDTRRNKGSKNKRSRSVRSRSSTQNRTISSSSSFENGESSDDPPQEDYDDLDDLYKEAKNKAEKDNKSKGLGDWLEEKIGKTKIGKYISRAVGGAEGILAKPMQFMTRMINKADETLFNFMYGGQKEIKDDDGKEVKGFFPALFFTIKKFFNDLKTKFTNWWKEKIWNDKVKEKVKKYTQPVTNEIKDIGKRTWKRTKEGVNNTFGKTFNSAKTAVNNTVNKLTKKLEDGSVIPTKEAIDIVKDTDNGIKTNARGGIVTKRGLTMISPGEMIIPATLNKKEQQKMLALEKRDRKKIYDAISLNATGTVDTNELRENLSKIYKENSGKGSKNIASGIVGAGVGGLLLGNPLLGAMAGAGLSILNNSETFKKIIFGEKGKDGLIPKTIAEAFPDMGDFGIAGGLLGLITPFGPLGGAAIGAGIGFLKHSQTFKKFIFGDEATGEDGLISKETREKAKKFLVKNAPKAAIGAIAGALLGPFGLIGNAALGAGAGLIASTSTFHDFLFGKKDDKRGGLAGAIKRGIFDPAKEKLNVILEDFKKFTKKNIFEPLKTFWDPFKQGLKNVVSGIGNGIKDKLNDIFEKHLGIPIHDWLQEKLFKPVTKLVFGILKAPYTLAKGVVAAPFKALQGIGNSMRSGQIKRGTAKDMSASERLAWREKHKFRSRFGDRYKEQDEMLADMSEEQLEKLRDVSGATVFGMKSLQRKKGETRDAVGEEFSKFMNDKGDDGKTRYNRVNISAVKKAVKHILENDTGDLEVAKKEIERLKGLTPSEKKTLLEQVSDKVKQAASARNIYNQAEQTAGPNKLGAMGKAMGLKGTLDEELSEILGRDITGRSDKRKLYEAVEAELKARRNGAAAEKAENESPEDKIIKAENETANKIIDKFSRTNQILESIAKGLGIKISSKEENTKESTLKEAAKQTVKNSNDTKAFEGVSAAAEKAENESPEDASRHIAIKEKLLSLKDKINPFNFFKNKKDGKDEEDSKEVKDARKEKEEKERKEQEKSDKSLGYLESIAKDQSVHTNTLVGDEKERKKNKKKLFGGGLLGKIGSTIGGLFETISGPLGKIGGKVFTAAKIIGGVALIGHLSNFAKKEMFPGLKEILFGVKDSNGEYQKKGLLSGFADGFHKLFYGNGTDQKPGGVLGWIRENILEPFNDIRKKGLARFIGEDIIPQTVAGWGMAIENVVTPLVAVLIKNLPSILLSLGKAILNGLKIAIFDKKIERSAKSMKMDDASGALAELENYSDSASAKLATSAGASAKVFSKNKSVYSTNSSSEINYAKIFGDNYAEADETYDAEGNHLNKTSDDILYEKAPGIAGILGAKKHTNEIYYDANGENALDSYSRRNTADSALSRVLDASKTGFRNAFLTGHANPIAARMAKVKIKPRGPGLISKTITGSASAMTKGAGAGMNAGGKAGVKFRNWMNSFIDPEDGIKIVNVGDTLSSKNPINIAKDKFGKTKLGGYFTNKKIKKDAISNYVESIVENSGKTGKKADKLRKKLTKKINTYGSEGLDDAMKFINPKTFTDEAADIVGDAYTKVSNVPLKMSPKGKVLMGAKNLAKQGVDKVKDTAVGRAATSAKNVVKDKVTNSAVGKAIGNVTKQAGGIGGKIANFFKGITENSTIMKYLRKASGKADDVIKKTIGKLAEKLGKTAGGKLAKNAVKKIAGVLNKLAWPIWIASCIYDFLKGYNNADTTLGIAKGDTYKISFGQKVICGLLNLVNEQLLLGLLPLDTIVDIFIEFLAPLFNIDVSEIQAARERSDEILDKWNKEHPEETYDNLEDFNNKDKWTTKAWKGIKNFFGFGKDKKKNKDKENKNTINKQEEIDETALAGGGDVVEQAYEEANIPITAKSQPNASYSYTYSNTNDIISNQKDIENFAKTYISKSMKYAINGDKYNIKDLIRDNDPSSPTKKVLAQVMKPMVGILGMFSRVGSFVFDNIKSMFTKARGDIQNGWDGIVTGNYSVFGDEYWKNVGGRDGQGRKLSGGFHETQSDPMYRNISYGDSTIAKSGCAPVAATNLVNSIMPGNSSVFEAADFAEKNNMTVPGGGTDIKFFNKYFSKHGISSITTNNKNAILSAVNKGNSVVLLGKDSSDAKGTAFGSNPHFITVKGLDKNGNFIVEDPDLPNDNIVYNKNRVLNSMMSSVITATSAFKPKGLISNRKAGGAKRSRLWGIGRRMDLYLNPDQQKKVLDSYNEQYGTNYSSFGELPLDEDGYLIIPNNDEEEVTNEVEIGNETTSESNNTESKVSVTALMEELSNLSTSYLKKAFGDVYDIMYNNTNTSESSNTEGNDQEGTVQGTTLNIPDDAGKNSIGELDQRVNEALVWKSLKSKGYSDAGIAAIMGNLRAESGMAPNNLQNSYEKSLGYTDKAYTEAIDNGSYNKSQFIGDKAGYGLAQWTFWSRKQKLFEKAKEQNKSIANLGVQLDLLDQEIGEYGLKDLVSNTTEINSTTDTICKDYEAPHMNNFDTRRKYANDYYNRFKGQGRKLAGYGRATNALKSYSSGRNELYYGKSRTSSSNNNVDYSTFLQTIVSVLMTISSNTALLNEILSILSEKFDINMTSDQIRAATAKTQEQTKAALNNLINKSGGNKAMGKLLNNQDTDYIFAAMAAIAQE